MPKPALFTTAPIDAPINALTIAQALRQAQQAGLERIDAQLLLLHLLGHNSRAWLLTHDDQLLTPAQAQQYAALCAQRLDAVPGVPDGLQRIFRLAVAGGCTRA